MFFGIREYIPLLIRQSNSKPLGISTNSKHFFFDSPELLRSIRNNFASTTTFPTLFCPPVDVCLSTLETPVEAYTLLKKFLVLWKRVELLKYTWGKRRLGVEAINTPSLFQMFWCVVVTTVSMVVYLCWSCGLCCCVVLVLLMCLCPFYA